MEQIEEYYSSKGLSVVGYFHANERAADAELSGVAKNIGDQIYKYFPQAAIFLVGFIICYDFIGRLCLCLNYNC